MLERIAALDPDVNSYVRVFAEAALADADAADRALADGRVLGPLHGVPVAVKDLVDVAGVPTTAGSPVFDGTPADRDAPVVARLRAAGAVLLGKVRLTEGAFSEHHPELPSPVNPFGADRWPGVSSSGSGVCVAAGLAFATLGTDTGGSIRFPCAACGLVGLKPSFGRVSTQGVFPLAPSLDHVGPMARTVDGVARVFEAIAEAPPGTAALSRRPRIGWDPRSEDARIDPVVAADLERVRAGLAAADCELVPLELPDGSALVEGWAVTCGVEAALVHREQFPRQRARYGPVLSALLDLGHRASGLQYVALERARRAYAAALDVTLGGVDAVLLPTMPVMAPSALEMASPLPAGRAEAIEFTAPVDYSGHPALVLPTLGDGDTRPGSFQLVGRHGDEARLFALGRRWEAVRGAPLLAPGLRGG